MATHGLPNKLWLFTAALPHRRGAVQYALRSAALAIYIGAIGAIAAGFVVISVVGA